MIKDNQVHLNRAHAVLDGLIIAGSYIASYFIIKDPSVGQYTQTQYFNYLKYIIPSYLILYYMMQLYTSKRALKLWDEFVDILDNKGGFVLAHWDGTTETEEKIKELTKATIRCIPLDSQEEDGKCILTGKPSTRRVLFARAY